jgi:hypothetical protein
VETPKGMAQPPILRDSKIPQKRKEYNMTEHIPGVNGGEFERDQSKLARISV